MAEYIKKEDIEQKIQDGLNNLVLGHDAIEVLGMIYETPSADVAPVRPELRKAVKELHKQYERAINSPAVIDPLAWSLYRTWVQSQAEEH